LNSLEQNTFGKSLVIQKHLEGKSMDQIARETNISKGKVHYVIKGWKDKIDSADYDEIATFAKQLNKSNITIEQCAQGFRMINILNSFGIGIDDDEDVEDKDNHSKDNVNYINHYKDFSWFIEEI
jgi:hypothetical protein